MAAIVSARVDYRSGWVQCTFPFDRQTMEKIKVPGARWDPDRKCWWLPINAWIVLKEQLRFIETIVGGRSAMLTSPFLEKLKPYQIDAASFLIRNGPALLSMEQRTGKTPTSLSAMEALFASGQLECALVFYPSGVKENWRQQIKDWTGRTLIGFETQTAITPADIAFFRSHPDFIIGCHWDILRDHVEELKKIVEGRAFLWIGDEIHSCKNRKGHRYKALREISMLPTCVSRWGLTGTPQRNYPQDLWGIFDVIQPQSMGTFGAFAGMSAPGTGYCGAFKSEMGYWQTKGESNADELRARLRAFSFRVTRAEVAAHLPKAQRSVILCDLPHALAKQYKSLEQAMAVQLKGALADADPNMAQRDALREMALCTSQGKIPTAIDRALNHAQGRGVKCIVFAHHHEVLRNLIERFQAEYAANTDAQENAEHRVDCNAKDPNGFCLCMGRPPVYLAAGWMNPTERHLEIQKFKEVQGPAIMLANTLSVAVGIDLSEADTEIFLEVEWVPSDFAQVHDRIMDMHLGKRTTPPLYEYLLAKSTIDVDMTLALINKIKSITNIVGADSGSADMSKTLRESGVVEQGALGLENNDKATVRAAIAGLRAKLLGISDETTDPADDKAKIAASFGAEWDEEMLEEAE